MFIRESERVRRGSKVRVILIGGTAVNPKDPPMFMLKIIYRRLVKWRVTLRIGL